MGMYASWVHGNALTVENPENLNYVKHFGWGTVADVKHGKEAWFHIALPTPVILNGTRSKLDCVFLMFRTEVGVISSVHVYDGRKIIQEFNNLDLDGDFQAQGDIREGRNKFLTPSHSVVYGIGISFLFSAAIGFDSPIPPSKLILSAAGGDYNV